MQPYHHLRPSLELNMIRSTSERCGSCFSFLHRTDILPLESKCSEGGKSEIGMFATDEVNIIELISQFT